MNTIKTILTSDNRCSCSKAKNFLGIVITDENGSLCNGEYDFDLDGEKVLVRFHDGLIDGNIYSDDGKILNRIPALEYSNGGTEYWTKGFPDGYPAVIKDFGYYEEDWKNGKIEAIRNEIKLNSLE